MYGQKQRPNSANTLIDDHINSYIEIADGDPDFMMTVIAIDAYRDRAARFDPEAEGALALLLAIHSLGYGSRPTAVRTLEDGLLLLDFFAARAAVHDPGAAVEVAEALKHGEGYARVWEEVLRIALRKSPNGSRGPKLRLIEGGKTQ